VTGGPGKTQAAKARLAGGRKRGKGDRGKKGGEWESQRVGAGAVARQERGCPHPRVLEIKISARTTAKTDKKMGDKKMRSAVDLEGKHGS
jgi:hypothetical protein